jgi:hypothetical protein
VYDASKKAKALGFAGRAAALTEESQEGRSNKHRGPCACMVIIGNEGERCQMFIYQLGERAD